MQAYEFYGTSENGIIRIPDEYKTKIGKKFKVIILEDIQDVNENKIFMTENEIIRKKRLSAKGSLKGKIWMADDFDAPLEEMKEYME
jgi:hypothetical protein